LNRDVAQLRSALATRGVVLAVAVFVCSWLFLGHWLYAGKGSSDAMFYHRYGVEVRAGEVPYRDFAVEYPPGAFVAFVAPTYVDGAGSLADYERWFGRLMCLLGLGTLLLVAVERPPPWARACRCLAAADRDVGAGAFRSLADSADAARGGCAAA
jgi:hypothetical protein